MLTELQCRERNWVGFYVEEKNDFFLVFGSKIIRLLCRGMDIDLILQWRSKLT